MGQGLRVFRSLREALKEGFQVYDRSADGYIVRRRGAKGWELALVDCKNGGDGSVDGWKTTVIH